MESGLGKPQAAANFGNITFSIENASTAADGGSRGRVVVGGHTYAPGEIVVRITTNADGYASTAADTLPHGTYTMREESVPSDNGYKINRDWSWTFQIREEGVIIGHQDSAKPVESGTQGAAIVANQVFRNDIKWHKIRLYNAGGNQATLPNVPFIICSLTTGEAHVVVTDKNGNVNTMTGKETSHLFKTNASDDAVKRSTDTGVVDWKSYIGEDGHILTGDDGQYVGAEIDETKLNANAGIYFHGYAKDSDAKLVKPSDEHGALSYDTYQVSELPTSANKGLFMVTFTVVVDHDNTYSSVKQTEVGSYPQSDYVVDMETISDHVSPKIATKFFDSKSGNNEVIISEHAELTDHVTHGVIEPGDKYEVTGSNHIKAEDGTDAGVLKNKDGKETVSSTKFESVNGADTVEVNFDDVDLSQLEGRDIVAYEELHDATDKVIVVHHDITDENQTVHVVRPVPTEETEFVEKKSGSHEVNDDDSTVLIDHVGMTNLIVGQNYHITGTIHIKGDDGSDAGLLMGDDGNPIVLEKDFMAEPETQTVDVEFTANTSKLAGCDIVAFEVLESYTPDGSLRPEAQHEDFTNTKQIVHVNEVPAPKTPVESLAQTGAAVLPYAGAAAAVSAVRQVPISIAVIVRSKIPLMIKVMRTSSRL